MNYQVLTGHCATLGNATAIGGSITATPAFMPQTIQSSLLDVTPIVAIINSSGNFSITLLQGATVKLVAKDINSKVFFDSSIVITADTTLDISLYLQNMIEFLPGVTIDGNVNTIKLHRATAAVWTALNPILAEGELAVELDTKNQKLGDGITAWINLDYLIANALIPAITVVSETAYGQSSTAGALVTYARGDHTHGTPASTKDTTAITGLLKGNGTIISAASTSTDYLAPAAIGTIVQAYNSNIQVHIADVTTNPHAVTATQVGLGNVTNTSDENKPVSTAQQTALNLKANLISPSFTTPSLGVATGTSFNSITGMSTTATDIKINGTQSAGSLNTVAKADHVHPTDTSREASLGNPSVTGYVLASTTDGTRSWVVKGGASGGTPALTLGTTNTAGSSTNFIRDDDTILIFDATAPTTQAFGDAATVGSATVAARRDHKHAMMAAPNATFTTALTVNTGTVTLTGNSANTSVLTLGAGASSISGSNTGDQTNIVGTAANLSGTPALPNGTTATTQSNGDNSTKLATTAYVASNSLTNPMSASGDIIYGGTAGAATRLAKGTDYQSLIQVAGLPSWVTPNIDDHLILNGDFSFDQNKEGGWYTSSATEVYGPDQWRYAGASSGVFQIRTQSSAVPVGTQKALQINVTTANSSPTSTDNNHIEYPIEGSKIRNLRWGTALAMPLAFQFKFAASINGTYSLAFMNGDNSLSYVTSFAYAGSNSFVNYSMVIPGPTTGTWTSDTASFGLKVIFDLGTGSTYEATSLSSWNAAAKWAVSGSVKLASTLSASMYIADVQADPGSIILPFRFYDTARHLRELQRYYWKTFPQGTAVAQNAGYPGCISYIVQVTGAAGGYAVPVRFPTSMSGFFSAANSIVSYSPANASANWYNQSAGAVSAAPTFFNSSHEGVNLYNVQVAGDTAASLLDIHITVNARMGLG